LTSPTDIEGNYPLTIGASTGSLNTLSEESLQHAETWLHDCCRSHRKCTPSSLPESWYPTRLLYLNSSGDGHCKVRIIHTAYEKPNGPYATLSHRWGNDHFIKLTRSNLAAFTEVIPIAEFSKTFADAISVSLRLGIQYLWIDSLCILQDEDDLSDWLHEAGLMQRVYSCSYLNISASVAESSSEGLSRNRDPSRLYRPIFELLVQGSDTETGYETFEIEHDQLWMHNVAGCNLNTRGWVFQERLLSSRVLHFSYDQVFWECREHRACEIYPSGHMNLHQNFGRYHDTHTERFKSLLGVYNQQTQRPTDTTGDEADSVYDIWKGMVSAYCITSLTNPLDKLIALAGIAKQMSIFTRDTYIAGMWRSNLESELQWCSIQSVPAKPYPSVYRAPSWSWASIDAPVYWPNSYSDQRVVKLFKIVKVVLQHETDNIMGLVKSGWLDVKGQLKPATLTWAENYQREPKTASWQIDVDPTNFIDSTNIQSISQESTVPVYLDIPTTDPTHFSDDNANERVFFMPMGTNQSGVQAWLLRNVDTQSGTFKRMGMCFTSHRLNGAPSSLLLAELKETVKETLPCLKYEDGLHTIRIV
jgi:hypothetical protein